MKPVIALPVEHYESLLKRATEDSPLYFRLKNAVKMANTGVVRCDPEHAEMLLQAAKHFWPTLYQGFNKRDEPPCFHTHQNQIFFHYRPSLANAYYLHWGAPLTTADYVPPSTNVVFSLFFTR